ncbi:MAG: tetratricopeptide repeat protein [Spirochaetales bacterium]|nr:MAG: tetratricopeptide repeat protein [Spirochaetales bacterium]
MPLKKIRSMVLVILLVFIQAALWGQTVQPGKAGYLGLGLERFNNGLYKDALESFRIVLSDPSLVGQYGDAYFWTIKSMLALNMTGDAEKNIEFYLLNYPNHQGYPEILYQKGRLLYAQEDYNNAIQLLYGYIDKYPGHPFVGNSYYWIGESLYSMGKFDDALKVFSIVINKYPESFKIDAARYKIGIIELKFREQELLKFLKWSHEETLRTLEDYKIREKTYEQAISALQRKVSDYADKGTEQKIQELTLDVQEREKALLALEDSRSALRTENDALKKALAEAQSAAAGRAQPETASTAITAGTRDTASSLLQFKGEALDLKEFYLRWLSDAQEQ